jgi:hypothetical protein
MTTAADNKEQKWLTMMLMMIRDDQRWSEMIRDDQRWSASW